MLHLVVLQGGFVVGCHAATQCYAKKAKYFYIGSSWGTFVLSETSVTAWHVREILSYEKMHYFIIRKNGWIIECSTLLFYREVYSNV